MKIWVAVTDKDWFDQLALLRPDEVNFWQPSGSRSFKVLVPGEPFLFKLHSPHNFVVGGGFFVRYSALPASLAWDAFQLKNGVASFEQLRERVQLYRPREATPAVDPLIGCNVLVEPFFLERSQWIPVPQSFALNIVSGKTYTTESEEGAALWGAVCKAMARTPEARESVRVDGEEERRFGDAYLMHGRLGQGAFRVLVTDAYSRRCAVTGEKTLPVLEAAHIKPYAQKGPHRVANGILLRSDLHKLFDLGYLTVTPELRLEVSSRLKSEWQNGREYYAYHGRSLGFLPGAVHSQPGREFLTWHNEHKFKE